MSALGMHFCLRVCALCALCACVCVCMRVCVCVCVRARVCVAGEFGYFEVEGCKGASPNLVIAADQEYRFIQQDISNWFHPIGFAYFPDGKFESLDDI